MRNFTTRVFIKASHKLNGLSGKAMKVLKSSGGEGFVDSAVSILISVVIGALLLSGLYLLFKDNILPTLSGKISQMFNYAG